MNIQCWFPLGLISLISLLSKRLSVLFQCAWVLSRFSHVWLSAILWTVAHQAPLSMGILRARILEWVAMPSFRGSSWPRDPTCISYISCIDRQFFTTSIQHHNSKASVLQWLAFFIVHLSQLYRTTRKTITLTIWTFVGKVMSLPFNMLSRLVIAFLPRSKCLFISWLQSLSEVILESRKIKSATVSTFSPSVCHEVMGLDAMILVLDSLKSFLSIAFQRCGANILCFFFYILSILGSGYSLMAARSPSGVSSGLMLEGCDPWWLLLPCLLIWQEILHFSWRSNCLMLLVLHFN